MALYMWHPVVIEKEAIVKLRPFKVGVADFLHDGKASFLRRKLESAETSGL